MLREENYRNIIEAICEVKGIKKEEIIKIMKDRECKYLFFMLLKKYKCENIQALDRDFLIHNKNSINYGAKKGEERVFINKNFRETYFEIETIIEKIIENAN